MFGLSSWRRCEREGAAMYKSILAPVDLAEPATAQPAIEAAIEFANLAGGRVRLINIQSLLPATFMDYVPADFDIKQKENAEKALAEMVATVKLPDDRKSAVVRIGGVYPEILAEAKDWGADLIVIGSHRPAMSTYLLGSNATTVVRHAMCSVLVVRK
jgi:nucleotide-binding universal stress UspA family protein